MVNLCDNWGPPFPEEFRDKIFSKPGNNIIKSVKEGGTERKQDNTSVKCNEIDT